MRRALIGVASILVVLAPMSGMAKDKTPKPVDPNKKTCRRDMATGSIVPKSICHTGAEWARIDSDNTRAADQALSGSMSGKTNPQ
jgi:hypothetical protein